MIRTVLVFVALVVLPSPVAAWRVRVPGSTDAGPIAVHPAGDVFAALGRWPRRNERATAVVRLAAANGKE